MYTILEGFDRCDGHSTGSTFGEVAPDITQAYRETRPVECLQLQMYNVQLRMDCISSNISTIAIMGASSGLSSILHPSEEAPCLVAARSLGYHAPHYHPVRSVGRTKKGILAVVLVQPPTSMRGLASWPIAHLRGAHAEELG